MFVVEINGEVPPPKKFIKTTNVTRLKFAGTEPSAVTKVSAKIILWADLIFAMEKKHQQRLTEKYPSETRLKKIVVLDIEDNYKYMDTELIEIIKLSVDPYLFESKV